MPEIANRVSMGDDLLLNQVLINGYLKQTRVSNNPFPEEVCNSD